VLILWGNNMAEMHPVLFSRVIDRRTRGEKVMVIDMATRRTRSTDFADHYLEFRPHSDLAIANGIAHLLLKNGNYNRAFVERHCNFRRDTAAPSLLGQPMTFEEYRKEMELYTPEHVEKVSGVPAEKIRLLGELFGRKDLRITSTWCMGFNQHSRGTDINRLCHGVHLLSGHFGRPGDAPTSLTGQPSACGTVREAGTLCHLLPGGRQLEEHVGRAQGGVGRPADQALEAEVAMRAEVEDRLEHRRKIATGVDIEEHAQIVLRQPFVVAVLHRRMRGQQQSF
jgi:nitrate reductase NapA